MQKTSVTHHRNTLLTLYWSVVSVRVLGADREENNQLKRQDASGNSKNVQPKAEMERKEN